MLDFDDCRLSLALKLVFYFCVSWQVLNWFKWCSVLIQSSTEDDDEPAQHD